MRWAHVHKSSGGRVGGVRVGAFGVAVGGVGVGVGVGCAATRLLLGEPLLILIRPVDEPSSLCGTLALLPALVAAVDAHAARLEFVRDDISDRVRTAPAQVVGHLRMQTLDVLLLKVLTRDPTREHPLHERATPLDGLFETRLWEALARALRILGDEALKITSSELAPRRRVPAVRRRQTSP